MQQNTQKDLTLIFTSIVVISLTVIGLMMFPDQAKVLADQLFTRATTTFGVLVQVLGFACVVLVIGLGMSKYGNIRLGEGKPEYRNTSWIFMFICAGLGSATMYWAFMEWAYYYLTPGLNITAASKQALEMSIAYSFFHWGVTPWAIYGIASLAMAYHFHVRKNKGLSLAGIIESITGYKAHGPVGRVIDLIFLFATFGGLVLTTTLTTSTVAKGLSDLTGLADGFMLKASLVILVTLVFSLSSYIGISSGMQRLAKLACGMTMLFALVVLLLGPTQFSVSNIANAIGLTLQNFIHMSLFTDPTGDGGFSRDWTVFYWLYWITYTPGVAIFVTRVSKGRTIREVVLAMILGGCGGCWFFFGSLQSFAIHQFVTDVVNAPAMLSGAGGEAAVSMLLASLPFGKLLSVVYFLLMLVFLASHLDAVAYTVAATSTRNLREGQDPSPSLRLFWCLMLAVLPLAMLYINASLNTLKTAVILTAIPFIFILMVKIWGLLKWLREDYAAMPAHLIEAQSARLAQGTACDTEQAPRQARQGAPKTLENLQ
ncbi:BCCT family transporter [Pseudomonas qingdaonensis]|jgi:BCCT family betaine/carnitine transporter|uniref:BCCT family transporter n=2 Tax=cellular organisms TaxID=131567 RepID=A0ABX8DXB5_9PSED|nr:BCCT family transporter [Pseudomonas qingdaonensis]QVL20983.1 BCCT family transporter [Pseudomonas qingdaonensis]